MDLTNIQYNETNQNRGSLKRITSRDRRKARLWFLLLPWKATKICNTKISLIGLVYEETAMVLTTSWDPRPNNLSWFSFCWNKITTNTFLSLKTQWVMNVLQAIHIFTHTQMWTFYGIPLVSSKELYHLVRFISNWL
jgi:hypothetical protein